MPWFNARSTVRTYLKQIVYGGNDGIITTFAIVAGFAGAQADGTAGFGALAVLVFGMANLTADAISMGLGEFLSGRSNRDLYRARHDESVASAAAAPEKAADALADHLSHHGLAPDIARHTADHLATSPDLMADLALRYQHGMEAPDAHNLGMRALMTFVAFILFGAIPIAPFVVAGDHPAVFPVSVAGTFGALAMLGLLRWSATHETLRRCIGETLVLGGLCAAVAYGAGRLVVGIA